MNEFPPAGYLHISLPRGEHGKRETSRRARYAPKFIAIAWLQGGPGVNCVHRTSRNFQFTDDEGVSRYVKRYVKKEGSIRFFGGGKNKRIDSRIRVQCSRVLNTAIYFFPCHFSLTGFVRSKSRCLVIFYARGILPRFLSRGNPGLMYQVGTTMLYAILYDFWAN